MEEREFTGKPILCANGTHQFGHIPLVDKDTATAYYHCIYCPARTTSFEWRYLQYEQHSRANKRTR